MRQLYEYAAVDQSIQKENCDTSNKLAELD